MDSVWERVCALTHAGRLGHAAKIAARLSRDPPGGPVLVCVYVPDALDVAHVMRALCTLRDEGLARGTSNFKTDEQTRQGVYAAGDKRPHEAMVQWPADVPVSRYTSPPPPPRAPQGQVLLHINHVTQEGRPWQMDGVEGLTPRVRCLAAQRAAAGEAVHVFPAPWELIQKK